jgi:flagellar hook protein FlgE
MLSVTMAGLNAAQKSMDVTSNNMANANTVGFKRSTANFGDVFSNDPASNPKTSVGSGVLTSSVSRDTTAGAVKTTGRVTDLAIDGRGFFVVRDPSSKGDSFSFSRAGNFGLDSQGYMVDPSGNQLIGYASKDSGTVDANGKPIMTPDVNSAKLAVQITPQFTTGQTLPDGSIVGQEIQDISLQGPALASGKVTIGGVTVDITKGDTVAQIAQNVATALQGDAAFQSSTGRVVSVVGTGDNSKVRVSFALSEGAVAPLTITTPPDISPQVTVGSPYIGTPDIQQITLNNVTTPSLANDAFTATLNGTTLTSANFIIPAGSTSAQAIQLIKDNIASTGKLPAGATITVDGTDPTGMTLAVKFGNTAGPQSLIQLTDAAGTFTSATASTSLQAGQFQAQTEAFTFDAAPADGTVSFDGVTVNVSDNDTPASIASKFQQALSTQNTVVGRTYAIDPANPAKVIMTFAGSEGQASLIQPKVSYKKATSGSTTEIAKGGLDPVLMQGVSISPKGEIVSTYSNGQSYSMGYVAIATFANDGGLKDIGGNRFMQTGDSGMPNISAAGAPKAGNIMSGALEQANVDITAELMDMIRSQQVYNGNARVLQTTVDTVTKITDMR